MLIPLPVHVLCVSFSLCLLVSPISCHITSLYYLTFSHKYVRFVYVLVLLMQLQQMYATVIKTYVIYVIQEWNDYNLRWNETEYGGVKDLRITPNKLWKPDVLMYNR